MPRSIADACRRIHLNINIMYINKVSYMTAICNHIKLISYIVMNDQDVHWVSNTIEMIIKKYNQHGFRVRSVSGSDIFSPLKDWLAGMHNELETYNIRAHITAIEINNRILKERIKCVTYNMPFAKLPRDFLVVFCNLYVNGNWRCFLHLMFFCKV